jgi:DNA-binding transcriptional LysR family regulator
MENANHISLRQLRCFITVADELHFRRAADRLRMRQPPLTKRIQDLERDLGVDLFRRIGNKVELTDAGKMLLNRARDVLGQAEAIRDAAQRAARGEYGKIRVALPIAALYFRSIQDAMRAFQQEYPSVSLELTQVAAGPALEGIRQRKFDACLMRAFPSPLPSDCEESKIARDRLMLVLPAGHPRRESKSIPLSAIADEKYVSLASKRGLALYEQITNLWEKSGLRPPSAAQEADNGSAVLGLVAAGLGNAILPSSLQVIRFEHIVWKTIEIDERWTESTVNLVYHKEALAERVPAAFIKCMRRHSCEVSNIVWQFG